MKKYMEYRVEGRRQVGRPMSYLESMEADMAELLDRQRICARQEEMEKECYDEEVQPYRKTDYKPIIY